MTILKHQKKYDRLIPSLNIVGLTDLNMSGDPSLSNDQHMII